MTVSSTTPLQHIVCVFSAHATFHLRRLQFGVNCCDVAVFMVPLVGGVFDMSCQAPCVFEARVMFSLALSSLNGQQVSPVYVFVFSAGTRS